MTIIKVPHKSNPPNARLPNTGKKLENSKENKQKVETIPLLPIIFICSVVTAWCLALLLNSFGIVGNDDWFDRSSQELRNHLQHGTPRYRPHSEAPNDKYNHQIDGYEPFIAIEYGAFGSRVGASVDGVMEIFPVNGRLKTPNSVAYSNEGVLVGQDEMDLPLVNPKNIVYGMRSIMGRRFSTDQTLHRDTEHLPYEVINKEDKPFIRVIVNREDIILSPEQIQAEIFRQLKLAAQDYYGEEITHTIMTVPAYFTDDQRQAVKDSARLAGLEVLRLVNEPTAAAIGYNAQNQEYLNARDESFVLVFNTENADTEVTISSIEDGMFGILSTTRGECTFYPPNPPPGESVDDRYDITTEQYQDRIDKHIAEQLITTVQNALTAAKLRKGDLSILIMTGDESAIHKIQPFLETFFDGKTCLSGVSPDTAVLRGAVYQAEILSGDLDGDWVGAFDITSLTRGIETAGGLFQAIIPRNTLVPTRKFLNVTTIHDKQTKMMFNIYVGERAFVKDNTLLGSFELDYLEEGPAGQVVVEVVCELDTNVRLEIRATELGGGNMAVWNAGEGFDERHMTEDLKKMLVDAERYREEEDVERWRYDGKVADGDEFGIVVVPRKEEVEQKRRQMWK
ncbi:uncharacterized protein RSE6_14698 [Rhynchosporium secalis]|uniref:non-chaperonin molecular chaperone ATPase n=1 Tax=Rhynchosporium secalis TaxID=38038 RepID=A0A1E1MVW6_RHYSE|nr:uncharacterized protein RSE6_14698 [Rhynchosporium secalis]